MKKATTAQAVTIKAPNFQTAIFEIEGVAPLVIHRMSQKYKIQKRQEMETGKPSGNKKIREAVDIEDVYNAARYKSPEGWDGFHAGAIRAAMISACRLVGFKMTLAKLSVFVIQDGWDKDEPQIPLIKINGKPEKQEDMGKTSTGLPLLIIRAAYYEWSAKIKILWDADQFTSADIYNLLSRAGRQVGIGEGRPDSRMSAGMGWGLFQVSENVQVTIK